MKTRKEIKENAKELLGRRIFGAKWMWMLLAILIISAIIGATSSFVVGVIFAGVFTAGLSCVLLRVARKEDEHANIGKLFSTFGDGQLGKYIGLGLLQMLFIFLWSLLLIIPGIIKSYAYSMSYYIQLDNPDMGPKDSITASRKMMKGHKWQLFVMDLSFIGWYIVGFLCLGVGVLWVHPYYELSKALFYEELKAEQSKE